MSWFDLPTWLQLLVGLAIIGAGVALCFLVSVRIGIIVLALGVGVVVICGRDSSDRRGYKF